MNGDTSGGGGGPREASGFGQEPYDPREDHMAPPEAACECFCMHCRRIFMSDQMWFQRVIGDKKGFPGFWRCPTPNCDGAGFTFDIFPTDPDHPANEGWQSTDDCDEPEDGERWAEAADEWDEEFDDVPGAAGADEIPFDDDRQWDPAEPQYNWAGEWGSCEDDLEGEEWKLGLAPGERPQVEPPPPGVEPRNRAEEEALYNAPDRRPRELDWSHKADDPLNELGEDDIPY